MPIESGKSCPNCKSQNIKIYPDLSGFCLECKSPILDVERREEIIKKSEVDEKEDLIKSIYSKPSQDDKFPEDFNPVNTKRGMHFIALGFRLIIISLIAILVLSLLAAIFVYSGSSTMVLGLSILILLFAVLSLIGDILAIIGVIFLHLGRKEYKVGKHWLNLGTIFIVLSFICGFLPRLFFGSIEPDFNYELIAGTYILLEITSLIFFGIGFAILPREVVPSRRWPDFLKGFYHIMGALGVLIGLVALVFITPSSFVELCCLALFIGMILSFILYFTGLLAFMRAYEDGPEMPYRSHFPDTAKTHWTEEK